MNPTLNATRLGIARGWIEFKAISLSSQSLIGMVSFTIILLIVLWFQRGSDIEGVSLALLTLPGLLGVLIADAGLTGVASVLATHREDGTLLRAKTIPQGTLGYLIARIIMTILAATLGVLLLLLPGLFVVPGLLGTLTPIEVLMFIGILLLGLLATAPFGAIIGASVKNSGAGFGLSFLPLIVLVAISGIFYPITALAGWLQVVAQVFPVYWLGLGVRSVFLPDSAAALELTGTWRTAETVIVLAAWAVVGLVLAPRILRRMAKRTSGSSVKTEQRPAVAKA